MLRFQLKRQVEKGACTPPSAMGTHLPAALRPVCPTDQNSGPEHPCSSFSPWPPPCRLLTFQQGLQDGHVHVLLAILAFPEDGQQLPPPNNVLDLQQAFPKWGPSDERASCLLLGPPENGGPGLGARAGVLPACVAGTIKALTTQKTPHALDSEDEDA